MKLYASDRAHFIVDTDESFIEDTDGFLIIDRLREVNWRLASNAVGAQVRPVLDQSGAEDGAWTRSLAGVEPAVVLDKDGA